MGRERSVPLRLARQFPGVYRGPRAARPHHGSRPSPRRPPLDGYQTDTKKISAVSTYFETMPYRLDETTGLIDYDALEANAKLFRPKLIVAGASAFSRLIDYNSHARHADQHKAYLLSHGPHLWPRRLQGEGKARRRLCVFVRLDETAGPLRLTPPRRFRRVRVLRHCDHHDAQVTARAAWRDDLLPRVCARPTRRAGQTMYDLEHASISECSRVFRCVRARDSCRGAPRPFPRRAVMSDSRRKIVPRAVRHTPHDRGARDRAQTGGDACVQGVPELRRRGDSLGPSRLARAES